MLFLIKFAIFVKNKHTPLVFTQHEYQLQLQVFNELKPTHLYKGVQDIDCKLLWNIEDSQGSEEAMSEAGDYFNNSTDKLTEMEVIFGVRCRCIKRNEIMPACGNTVQSKLSAM